MCLIRTARADHQGTALSFVSEKEMESLQEVEEFLVGGKYVVYLWRVCIPCCSECVLFVFFKNLFVGLQNGKHENN